MTESLLEQRVRLSSEVLFQEVGGEAVLLDLRSESYFGLNEVGARVWQLLQERSDPKAVLDALSAEYEVDEGTLANDLVELITDMADAGLVTLRSVEDDADAAS